MLQRLEERRRLPHRLLITEILRDITAGATSHLELRALRDVLSNHGFPEFTMQAAGSGQQRVDVLFAAHRVIVEFDGRPGHTGEGAFRDMRRDNAHLLSGYATLRFGWDDVVRDPCGVARQIAQLLRQAGWDGFFDPCAHCASRNWAA